MSRTETSRIAKWRRSLAIFTTLGVLASAGAASAQVAPPAVDRLWGGCQLNFNSLSSSAGQIDFDFLILYSLVFPNDGQPYFTVTPPSTTPRLAGFTGPVVCTANGVSIPPAERVSIQSYSEAVNIPNTLAPPPGNPPGNSVDVLPSVLGTAIRYRVGINPKKQVCHQSLDTTQCYTIEFGTGGGCTIAAPQYNTIRNTIRAALPPFTENTTYFVGYSVVVAYKLDSSAPPRVCATPLRRLTATGDSLTGQVLDVENIDSLRYKINGGARAGKIEARPCHTVADKTDCFRIYK